MNKLAAITSQLKGDSFQSLVQEADTSSDAMQLLEIINLALESYIFFTENGINFRAEREATTLLNIFNQLDTIYNNEN